ncbi:MAG: CDGSH iron-sulfur domain-containing protein [Myxococcota bacterium]
MADDVKTYSGASVDMTWDRRLCIHVGECGRAANALFVGGRKPWGDPDQGTADEVAETVRRCPTGALAYVRNDGGPAEVPAADNTVVVSNHGPLYVTGDLEIEGAKDDMPGVAFRAALCRCGLSKNKPFCDNSHESGNFQDRGAVGERGPRRSATGGPLVVGAAPNGPLLLKGNFRIVASSGRVAWEGEKAALCRCGHSKNKPFCDGAHRDAGFDSST